MVALWVEVLGRPIRLDDDVFRDVQADSWRVLELLDRIMDEFGVVIAMDELFDAPTARGAADLVTRLRADTPS